MIVRTLTRINGNRWSGLFSADRAAFCLAIWAVVAAVSAGAAEEAAKTEAKTEASGDAAKPEAPKDAAKSDAASKDITESEEKKEPEKTPLTPEQYFEGGENTYNNWMELGVGGLIMGGSKAQGEQDRHHANGAFGGIEDFHYQGPVATNLNMTVDGRALFDQNDYKVSLGLTRPTMPTAVSFHLRIPGILLATMRWGWTGVRFPLKAD